MLPTLLCFWPQIEVSPLANVRPVPNPKVDYGNITTTLPNLSTVQWPDLATKYLNHGPLFDVAISFSSVEHSGLGRYGDPLNPFGDLEATAQSWCLLKPNGLFFIGVPTGRTDYLFWNVHRIYGPLRFPHLTANFRHLDLNHPVTGKKPWEGGGTKQYRYQPMQLMQRA